MTSVMDGDTLGDTDSRHGSVWIRFTEVQLLLNIEMVIANRDNDNRELPSLSVASK